MLKNRAERGGAINQPSRFPPCPCNKAAGWCTAGVSPLRALLGSDSKMFLFSWFYLQRPGLPILFQSACVTMWRTQRSWLFWSRDYSWKVNTCHTVKRTSKKHCSQANANSLVWIAWTTGWLSCQGRRSKKQCGCGVIIRRGGRRGNLHTCQW